MSSVEEFLNNADYESYPGLKFENIGDGVKGVIVGKPRLVDIDEDDGSVRKNLVINIEVAAGKGSVGVKDGNGKRTKRALEVGETVSVWISGGGRSRAVAKAVKAANAKEVAEGGELSIRFSAERDTGNIQPAKEFEATYTPPARGTAVPSGWDSGWGDDSEPF